MSAPNGDGEGVRVVEVPLAAADAARSYPIYVDHRAGAETRFAAALARHAPGAVAIVSDETTGRLHGARFHAALAKAGVYAPLVIIPDGEGSKSLANAGEVCESLLGHGLDRSSLLVALGGGVVGDLTGFVASIFLRGIPYVQVPTTLLAQVDSSVGGKTGVNLGAGKNLAGSFWQPLFVYADITALATLGPRDRAAGLAEVVKHGAIADAGLFALLEERAAAARAGDAALMAELVARSCAIKARVVAADERETSGARAQLNFGHTIGHAIEAVSHLGATPLRHGEAVALGMLAAARVGQALGAGDGRLEARLTALCAALDLPTELDVWLAGERGRAVMARVAVDKKRRGDSVAFVVVEPLGSAELRRVTLAELRHILLGE